MLRQLDRLSIGSRVVVLAALASFLSAVTIVASVSFVADAAASASATPASRVSLVSLPNWSLVAWRHGNTICFLGEASGQRSRRFPAAGLRYGERSNYW
jgi:hypothetical protein